MARKELLAACGLYCGVCGVLIAHRDGNTKLKERLCTVYGCTPEEIVCEGCFSGVRFKYCVSCPIRACADEKGIDGCHQCDDFPCMYIENFPIAVGKKVILRATPNRRAITDEQWAEEEEKRYRCPSCGYQAFRGVKRCRSCGEQLDLD